MSFQITRGIIQKPQKVVIYGPEGIGKTTLAAQFPSPLFIDTEDGSGHVDVARINGLTSWQMLMDAVTWVRDFPYECGGTLVLDTADWAERLCISTVCGEHKWKGIEDAGYGKGYTYVKERFGELLNLLSEVCDRGLNVVVTAHSQIVKFEQPDEAGAYDRYELKLLRKQTAPMLKEWADALLFANFKTVVISETGKDGKVTKARAQGGRNRVLHTTHAASWDAKNRWGLPDEIPMEWQHLAPYIPVPQFQQAAAPVPTQAEIDAAQDIPVPFDEPGAQAAEPAVTTVSEPACLAPVRDLMAKDGISETELTQAIAKKGYMTADTPMNVWDEEFAGWVVSAWDPIRQYIRAGMPDEQ